MNEKTEPENSIVGWGGAQFYISNAGSEKDDDLFFEDDPACLLI